MTACRVALCRTPFIKWAVRSQRWAKTPFAVGHACMAIQQNARDCCGCACGCACSTALGCAEQ
eukprot:15476381-Alexandrium_andersonii.AAC.1